MASNNKQSFGDFVEGNKFIFVSGIVILLLLVLGIGGVIQYSKIKNVEKAEVIYKFKSGVFADFKDSKIDETTFLKELDNLVESIGSYSGLASFIIEISDIFVQESKRDLSLKVLMYGNKFVSQDPFLTYMIYTRLAVLYEDLGKVQEAIDILEKLNRSGLKTLKYKTHLDLGRLYLKIGNKEKAKMNLDYVVSENSADKSNQKLAKLYLEQL